jgi:hypothetical protein
MHNEIYMMNEDKLSDVKILKNRKFDFRSFFKYFILPDWIKFRRIGNVRLIVLKCCVEVRRAI